MINFRFLGFPITIQWFFWLNCALLSGALSSNQRETPDTVRLLLSWTVVAFTSVLIHELGHAFTMRHYGDQRVRIVLHGLGGYAQGSRVLTRSQGFYVSAAGPFTQIAAAVVVWWVSDLWMPENRIAAAIVSEFISISIFWAVLNLLPIIPLDGGHIALALLGPRREKLALMISLAMLVLVGGYAFSTHRLFGGLLCVMMAIDNWKRLQGQPQISGFNTP